MMEHLEDMIIDIEKRWLWNFCPGRRTEKRRTGKRWIRCWDRRVCKESRSSRERESRERKSGEGKSRERKGRERKSRKRKSREGSSREGKSRERKSREGSSRVKWLDN